MYRHLKSTQKQYLSNILGSNSQIILVKSLVGGALDTLEGEHSAKLRRASILVILSALFTHREMTLEIVDEKIGLKYFLDEWLEESDYAEIM